MGAKAAAPTIHLLPDAGGKTRPTWAPKCCTVGVWVIHPKTKKWACSECEVYKPKRKLQHPWARPNQPEPVPYTPGEEDDTP